VNDKPRTFDTMKILFVLFVVLVFILDSCSTTELLTSDVKPSEVVDLQSFEPVSYVSGNKEMLNDSLSRNSRQCLNEIIQEFKDKISLTGTIIVSNKATKQRLEKDIEYLIMSANDIKLLSISSIRITPLIDSLLESNGKRFGLIEVENGSVQSRWNYAKQTAVKITGSVVIGLAISALTHSHFQPLPLSHSDKSFSVLYVMIVDADQDNIAFYRKSSKNGDPTDKNVLTYQFKKIFKGYNFTKINPWI
jgi:hypothetical protein